MKLAGYYVYGEQRDDVRNGSIVYMEDNKVLELILVQCWLLMHIPFQRVALRVQYKHIHVVQVYRGFTRAKL